MGLSGAAVREITEASGRPDGGEPRFDLHPFVRAHPEAVFVVLTEIEHKKDAEKIFEEGLKLGRELIVRTGSGGHPVSTLVNIKHNWHGIQKVDDLMGENTDPNFIEGWIAGMMEAGPRRYYVNRPQDLIKLFRRVDLKGLAERNGVRLTDYNRDYWEVPEGAVRFVKIPNGVVFDTMGFISPFNEPGTFLVNMAKLKAHSMGITASVKNLQGLCPKFFRQFCTPHNLVRKRAGERYERFLKKDFEKRIEELYAGHVREGIPRWDVRSDKNGSYAGGIWQEQWTQRMMDAYSVSPTHLNIVEGIYAMDGNGFGAGPHPKSPNGYTSRDFMSNVVLFGLDPFRVDIISHWIAGHEPGNFGLFHIGIERGFSDVLDPHDIPLYLWKEGRAFQTRLEKLPRTPLKTPFLQRENEPTYHLCDEPFDYSAWKAGKRVGDCTPSMRELGRDAEGNLVMEVSLPERGHVYVDVLDADGELAWRLLADGELEPGVHQVVWDGFSSPGLYNVYMKGMGWDAERRMVIY